MKFGVLGPLEVRADHGVQVQAILGQGTAFQPETPRRPEAASSAPAKPAAPEAREPRPDARKTVTILFTDIVDSSRLSLSLDPEALRNLLTRYFGELSAVVQRHGGIVEKYIGDAIMAVFGVPLLHEDDALRAVRAAVEMRDTLAILNHELEAGWGVRLLNRIGINTGEVVAGDNTQGYLS
ncbi:MAG: adenylate/guanylate cyclase domain-containing protein, partial [Mesorhizobium sp.]